METISQICLLGAKKESGRNDVLAEKLYRRALDVTARCYGEKSAELGLMLVEFATFLETKNRVLEAELLYVRVHAVLNQLSRGRSASSLSKAWHQSGVN